MDKKTRNSGKRGKNKLKNRAEPNKKPAANATTPRPSRKSRKIADRRLTIPVGIFNRGVKSAVTTRSKAAGAPRKRQHKAVIEEDLHALLHEANPDSSGGIFESREKSEAFDTGSRNTSCGEYYRSLAATDNSPQVPGTEVEFAAGLRPKRSTGHAQRLTTKKIPDLLPTHRLAFDQPNTQFCSKLSKQLKYIPRVGCFVRVKLEINVIDDLLDGKCPPNLTMSSSKKRSIPDDDYTNCLDPMLLVPQSQWVYNTPDKQNMKKFVFEDGNTKFLPAVMHTSKKTKVLYDIKNEYAGHINLNRFKKGDGVPIDRRFLKTICESAVTSESDDDQVHQAAKKKRVDDSKENVFNFDFRTEPQNDFTFGKAPPEEFNMFQLRDTEESIDIHNEIQKSFDFANDGVENLESGCKKFDFGRCMSALRTNEFYEDVNVVTLNDDDNSLPADYKQQLLMATQRPCKTAKKVQKRHLLKAKSLSFENTPPGAKVACFEPKKIDLNHTMNEDECLEQFEREFGVINAPAVGKLSAPHTVTSGALESQGGLNDAPKPGAFSLVPDFKFFPRRNYDPE